MPKYINATKEIEELEDVKAEIKKSNLLAIVFYAQTLLEDAERVDVIPVKWVEEYAEAIRSKEIKEMLNAYRKEEMK